MLSCVEAYLHAICLPSFFIFRYLCRPVWSISPPLFLSLSLPPSWSNDSWSYIELLVGDQSSWSERSADCLSRGPLERTVWKCFVNLSCFKGQRIRKKQSLSEKCCCACVRVYAKEREALSASLWLRCPLLVWMLKQLATSSEPGINNFHCLSCRSEICTATARAERWDKRRGEVSRKSWHGERAHIRGLFYVACQYLLMRISTMICIVQFESNVLLTCRKLLWTGGALESLRVSFSGSCQSCYNFSNSLLLCRSSSFSVWDLCSRTFCAFLCTRVNFKDQMLDRLMTLRMCNLKPMCIRIWH